MSAYILSLILARSLRRHVIHLLLQCNYRGIAIQELSLKAFLCAIRCNGYRISHTALQKILIKLSQDHKSKVNIVLGRAILPPLQMGRLYKGIIISNWLFWNSTKFHNHVTGLDINLTHQVSFPLSNPVTSGLKGVLNVQNTVNTGGIIPRDAFIQQGRLGT